jgi:Putative DNA-binding domain
MPNQWDQASLEQYIAQGIQEHTTLEYKAAASLDKTEERKKIELSKDVSSMANSAGGIIVYGIKEFDDDARKHLPERLDGIDVARFSKEWLEQVINSSIHPRIENLIIHPPISLDTGRNHVAYVVEIPQSMTAHQAKDKRYHKRLNFTVDAMEDYEIRDVMGRRVLPAAEPEFGFVRTATGENGVLHQYSLTVLVKNVGVRFIKYFKLEFSFPDYGLLRSSHNGIYAYGTNVDGISIARHTGSVYVVTCRSDVGVFPKDRVDIGARIGFTYWSDDQAYQAMNTKDNSRDWSVNWTLYADDMLPKQGKVLLSNLHEF